MPSSPSSSAYDQDNRPLHFIEVVAAGGRIEFAYKYGTVPADEPGNA